MIICGLARLGRDAELRFLPDGTPVLNMNLAYNFGTKRDQTQWVDCAMWGKRAEAVAPYLKKGTQIDIVAEDLHIEEYQGKNGPGHKLSARIVSLEFAGKRDESSGGNSAPAQAPEQKPQSAPQPADLGDDIPF